MWRRAIATILACPSYDFSKYKVPSTIWDKFGLVPAVEPKTLFLAFHLLDYVSYCANTSIVYIMSILYMYCIVYYIILCIVYIIVYCVYYV